MTVSPLSRQPIYKIRYRVDKISSHYEPNDRSEKLRPAAIK